MLFLAAVITGVAPAPPTKTGVWEGRAWTAKGPEDNKRGLATLTTAALFWTLESNLWTWAVPSKSVTVLEWVWTVPKGERTV